MYTLFNWAQLLQPQFYVENGGLWLLLFVVFAETGLFVGFFLPGDSLLFVAGIFAHKMENGEPGLAHQFLKLFGLGGIQNEFVDLFVLLGLISVAGILGNMVGYWTGHKVGPAMFKWRDRFLFKKRYLHEAHDFYEKHGALAVVGARFLPFIRTFAPIVAGIVEMDRKKFYFFNVVGCVAWVFAMLFSGYFLQKWILQQFGFDLKDHLEIIVLGIVLVTTAPVIIKLAFPAKKKNSTPSANP
ncbi:MAG: VTT domain-containing protein [Chitinophagaceae bacterium]|nr:VTT domain-containing protein [Chitinophagaceae bacterium]